MLQKHSKKVGSQKRQHNHEYSEGRTTAKQHRTSDIGSVAPPPAACHPPLQDGILQVSVAKKHGLCLRLPFAQYVAEYREGCSGRWAEHTLGEGTYGTVILIRQESTGRLAACRRLASRFNDRAAEAEVVLADFLAVHPQKNCLGAFAIVLLGDAPSMVLMPFCDESLADKFDRHPDMKDPSCRDHVC
jgi:hypothetical protein